MCPISDAFCACIKKGGPTLDSAPVQAADVLIDDKTLSHAARGLARFVTAEFDANPTKETHNARVSSHAQDAPC